MSARRVLIAGGGLAGIAAAIALARRGVDVRLLETSRRLGGRATSFEDPRTGEVLDNCQHVAMGCCTAYLRLLESLGARDLLTWTREQTWIEPGGRRSVLRRGALPAPLHFAGSFARAAFLTRAEKAAIARAMLAIMAPVESASGGRTFGDWLDEQRQPEGARRRLWEPIVVSACNLSAERVDARLALKVFREGLLTGGAASDIGVPRVPLVRLYARAEGLIGAGAVMYGASVVSAEAGGVRLADGRSLEADAVICALPAERAARVLPADDPRRAALASVEHSPILGVHLALDRPVLDVPHAVLLGAGVQWMFRKDDAGARVHAVISAADDMVGMEKEKIVDAVMDDLRRALPAMRGVKLVWARPVFEKRATFAATPEFERSRPGAVDPRVAADGRAGVVLAGDFTATGWPATMEGAVRSGFRAAEVAMGLPCGAVW